MKNLPSSRLLRSLLAASLLAAAVTRVRAGDDDTTVATATLSAPDKPGTLQIEMPWADIKVVGVDGNTVTVESSLTQKGAKTTRSDGMRRLDDEVTFELSEKANVISLRMAGDNPWASHNAEFKIKMPRALALTVKTEAGGDLAVSQVDGDLDISNMNGDVHLQGITGSAIVNTMNGEVHAVYTKAPTKLVAITSMNGEVVLSVPADTKANVRLRTHNGAILTDFSDAALKTKTEGSSGGSYSRYGADAARAAAEATRAALRIARDVSLAVKDEVDRAKQESDDDDDATPKAVSAEGATPAAPAAPVTPRAPRAPRAPIPPIAGGKTVTGTLNGGGVDLKISTMNGEITLRQTK
jgi:hypothetical protein